MRISAVIISTAPQRESRRFSDMRQFLLKINPSRSSYIEHPVSRKVLRFLPSAQRARSYGLLRQRNLDGAKDNPFGFDVQGTENRMPLASPRPRQLFQNLPIVIVEKLPPITSVMSLSPAVQSSCCKPRRRSLPHQE